MDNIRKPKDADHLLKKLNLRVEADTVVKVLKVITGETPGSIFDLYSTGKRRNGTQRTALCGKGTVYKIKRLYKNGELDPFLEFIKFKVLEPDFKFLIADFEKKKTGQEARATFEKLIDDWEAEISLDLRYCDIEDLSRGETGVYNDHQITMTWEITKNGGIERRFSIENSDDFNNLKRCIPQAQKLWILFNECKRLGGVLINQCSDLINDIRNQSEVKTRLAFGFQDYSQPDKVRLDRFFAWSVYADALNILPNPDLDRTYHFERIGLDTAEIYWGDLGLAVVKFSETNKIIRAHKQLKALNKKSSQTKKIIDVKQLLNDAEIRLIKELKLIRQHIIAV